MDLLNFMKGNKEDSFPPVEKLDEWINRLKYIFADDRETPATKVNQLYDHIKCLIDSAYSIRTREHVVATIKFFKNLQDLLVPNYAQPFVKQFSMDILDIIIGENMTFFIKRELLKLFYICVKQLTSNIRRVISTSLPETYLLKLIDIISTFGDYDLQVLVIDTIFSLYGKQVLNRRLDELMPESEELTQKFSEIEGKTFFNDVRNFLTYINAASGKIFSFQCLDVILGNVKCYETVTDGDELWINVNIVDQVMSWNCSTICFSNMFIESELEEFGSITMMMEDILKIYIKSLNQSKLVLDIHLSKPCISSLIACQPFVDNAKQVTIVLNVSEQSQMLISNILPHLWMDGRLEIKDENNESMDYCKISKQAESNLEEINISKKISKLSTLYKPLKISIVRKSDALSNYSTASCKFFDPVCLSFRSRGESDSVPNTTRTTNESQDINGGTWKSLISRFRDTSESVSSNNRSSDFFETAHENANVHSSTTSDLKNLHDNPKKAQMIYKSRKPSKISKFISSKVYTHVSKPLVNLPTKLMENILEENEQITKQTDKEDEENTNYFSSSQCYGTAYSLQVHDQNKNIDISSLEVNIFEDLLEPTQISSKNPLNSRNKISRCILKNKSYENSNDIQIRLDKNEKVIDGNENDSRDLSLSQCYETAAEHVSHNVTKNMNEDVLTNVEAQTKIMSSQPIPKANNAGVGILTAKKLNIEKSKMRSTQGDNVVSYTKYVGTKISKHPVDVAYEDKSKCYNKSIELPNEVIRSESKRYLEKNNKSKELIDTPQNYLNSLQNQKKLYSELEMDPLSFEKASVQDDIGSTITSNNMFILRQTRNNTVWDNNGDQNVTNRSSIKFNKISTKMPRTCISTRLKKAVNYADKLTETEYVSHKCKKTRKANNRFNEKMVDSFEKKQNSPNRTTSEEYVLSKAVLEPQKGKISLAKNAVANYNRNTNHAAFTGSHQENCTLNNYLKTADLLIEKPVWQKRKNTITNDITHLNAKEKELHEQDISSNIITFRTGMTDISKMQKSYVDEQFLDNLKPGTLPEKSKEHQFLTSTCFNSDKQFNISEGMFEQNQIKDIFADTAELFDILDNKKIHAQVTSDALNCSHHSGRKLSSQFNITLADKNYMTHSGTTLQVVIEKNPSIEKVIQMRETREFHMDGKDFASIEPLKDSCGMIQFKDTPIGLNSTRNYVNGNQSKSRHDNMDNYFDLNNLTEANIGSNLSEISNKYYQLAVTNRNDVVSKVGNPPIKSYDILTENHEKLIFRCIEHDQPLRTNSIAFNSPMNVTFGEVNKTNDNLRFKRLKNKENLNQSNIVSNHTFSTNTSACKRRKLYDPDNYISQLLTENALDPEESVLNENLNQDSTYQSIIVQAVEQEPSKNLCMENLNTVAKCVPGKETEKQQQTMKNLEVLKRQLLCDSKLTKKYLKRNHQKDVNKSERVVKNNHDTLFEKYLELSDDSDIDLVNGNKKKVFKRNSKENKSSRDDLIVRKILKEDISLFEPKSLLRDQLEKIKINSNSGLRERHSRHYSSGFPSITDHMSTGIRSRVTSRLIDTDIRSRAIVDHLAPEWQCNAIRNGEFITVKSTAFRGRYLLLYFFPINTDNNHIDLPEDILELDERSNEFHDINADVVVCPLNLPCSKSMSVKGMKMPSKINLLLESTQELSAAYNVYFHNCGSYGRSAFIIDPEGFLIWTYTSVTSFANVNWILDTLQQCLKKSEE